jgi:hypothetical protein
VSDEEPTTDAGVALTSTQFQESLIPMLGRSLDSDEYSLIRAVWTPVEAGYGQWPVWDYVARTLARSQPPVVRAAELLGSLPLLPRGPGFSEYGPVWLESAGRFIVPNASETIGLSIVGMNALRKEFKSAGIAADALAQAIGIVAELALRINPDPATPVTDQETYDNVISLALSNLGIPSKGITQKMALEVLSREFVPLTATSNGHGDPVFNLSLHHAEFVGIKEASDYVGRLPRAISTLRLAPRLAPGELVRSLDFLCVVMESDRRWTTGRFLAGTPLQQVEYLSEGVLNEEGFVLGLVELSSIFDIINAPSLSDQQIEGFRGRQPGTLTRFKYWIQSNLSDESGMDRAVQCVEDLQLIRKVRVGTAHSADIAARKRSEEAQISLGLEERIRNWPTAWDLIRARAADAFNGIAQSVRGY